ncbi:hypothetical protein [Paraburkholderia kururiensis]|uniref:hypothetical protein n=1 Tax=Paraburkholderia kururiensis TaxID=984307 RepID=UPI0018F454B6|nr:hypothetical protein [Paraburkholderia kururiensis]
MSTAMAPMPGPGPGLRPVLQPAGGPLSGLSAAARAGEPEGARPQASATGPAGAARAVSHTARTARERHPLRLPLVLFGLTLLLIVLHQGRLVELVYPVGAFAIALRFYRRSPAHYLGFVCWLFFLSPEVRRLADFVNGSFNPKSPVMIAPMLAVALSGFSLLSNLRVLGERRAMPLVLVVLGLFYAYIVGVVRAGPAAATFTVVNWAFPVLVAFRLLVTWRDYPLYRDVLLKTFTWGGFAIGLYGVIQFISPPPWDAFWLLASQMESEGHPVPFGMRVSSTMNSSGPYAQTIMSILLMSLAARGRLKVATALVGVPSLMFTAVRSAWGGFALGLVYPLAMLDGKSRLRLLGALLGFALLGAPALMIDEISAPIMQRFDSMQNLGEDNSYRIRAEFYRSFLSVALTDISGQGLGTTGLGTKLAADDNDGTQANVVFDSGLMEVPYVMGWPGTLLYVTGVVMLLWRAFWASLARGRDRFAISAVGVALAMLGMMVFVNTLTGLPGLFFFVGVLLPAIAQRHAREMQWLRRRRALAAACSGAGAPPPEARAGTAVAVPTSAARPGATGALRTDASGGRPGVFRGGPGPLNPRGQP